MSLFITSLNSGSNGNCYYVGNHNEAVLVDAGISCREIENRMKRLNLDLGKVKGIFVSHEHADHIRGIGVLSTKHQIPVYITKKTLSRGRIKIEKHLAVHFEGAKPIFIGELMVTPFTKHHDAADPYSFTISCNNTNVGVYTDIGAPCMDLIRHFKQCHAAFLESNYDAEMLDNGSYPYVLKKRITGGKGHLSNKEAFELFVAHRPKFMSHLLLSHLSNNNNCPNIVQQLFESNTGGVKIIIASRFEESELFHIEAESNTIHSFKVTPAKPAIQLALSFE